MDKETILKAAVEISEERYRNEGFREEILGWLECEI